MYTLIFFQPFAALAVRMGDVVVPHKHAHVGQDSHPLIVEVSAISMYYTSREDSWFWLVKGHILIVMLSSLLSDRLLSLTAYVLIN